jgi:hypothetical protein
MPVGILRGHRRDVFCIKRHDSPNSSFGCPVRCDQEM